ncbi:TonB-dependent receptor [Haloferula sp. A504]|uniref:TonB-dependent receptor n=1 Tax=Haloferula sp. A504 TaxID=3373601 RepID=UPI0031C08DFB|nr:TonB-dependent receptor [Verrucomicrobiaceae bacterium E54]
MPQLTTYEKALALNLDPEIYGTFAEIGAGQEVANWFFRASASAGTVAKTISAYDMTMSDAIYGDARRYVSRQRLSSMLDHEFGLLTERLAPERGDRSTFFAFCNTVRARGYQDDGECHGWLGIRLQLRPGGEPNDILIHIRLLDDENSEQMEALGILGVNMIHAAFHQRDSLDGFTAALVEHLPGRRVEVDMLKFFGPDFSFIDNRLCSLQLVQSGLTDAAMFLPDGEVVQPAEVLYRRNLLLLRGSFDPVTKLHLDMLDRSRELFVGGDHGGLDEVIDLCEITMHNLLRGGGEIDHLDFLDRVDALEALGKHVLISDCPEFYRIIGVLSRYTAEPVGVILSIGLLNELFKPKWSQHLEGGLLESFGRLFKNQVRLYVYPWKNRRSGELVTARNFKAPEEYRHLYQYFLDGGLIMDVPCGNEALLKFTSRDIERMKQAGDAQWKEFVPAG